MFRICRDQNIVLPTQRDQHIVFVPSQLTNNIYHTYDIKNGIFHFCETKHKCFPSLRDRKIMFWTNMKGSKIVFSYTDRLTHSILSLLNQWMVLPVPVIRFVSKPVFIVPSGGERECFQSLWNRKIIFWITGIKI